MLRGMLVICAASALAACGTSDQAGDPLISGSVQASFDGNAFTPTFGFATIYQGQAVIGITEAPLHCGSENMSSPPSGSGLIIALPAPFAVSQNPQGFVQVYRNAAPSGYEAVGSTGTVDIVSVTSDSIAGDVAFTFTDDMSRTFTANGTFQVVNCMP